MEEYIGFIQKNQSDSHSFCEISFQLPTVEGKNFGGKKKRS